MSIAKEIDKHVVFSCSGSYHRPVDRAGANLALLLLATFRSLAQDATERLALRGFEDFRPSHEFAMRAVEAGADNASELGRRLSVSKQAAAKTITLLEARGYVERALDAQDGRRKHLRLTPRGKKVLRTGEQIFNELRSQWAEQIGTDKLQLVESVLTDRLSTLQNGLANLEWLAQEAEA